MHAIKEYIELNRKYRGIFFWSIIQIIYVCFLICSYCGYQRSMNISKPQFNNGIEWNEITEEDGNAVSINGISLKNGSYNIRVYFDIVDLEKNREDNKQSNPLVIITSEEEPLGVRADNRWFAYGDTWCDSTLNIGSFRIIDDLRIICKGLPDNYSVKEVVLTENIGYRFFIIIIWIVVFLGIDYGLLYYLKIRLSGDYKRVIFHIGIGLTLIFSFLPVLRANSPTGDDYIFHLSRIYELSKGLFSGHFPIRIYEGANNGYSYASPLFYSDFFLLIPALLYKCGIQLRICFNAYVVLINVITAYTTDFLFRNIYRREDYLARWGGVSLYVLSYYRIVNEYTRSAVGEYTAMAFIPLIAIGVYGMCNQREISNKNILCTLVGATGIIQSHILTVEIAGLVSMAYMLFKIKKWLKRRKLVEFLTTGCLIICINLWFIFPMLDSWSMNLAVFNRHEKIQRYGLYMSNLFSVINRADGSAHGLGGAILFGLILSLVALIMTKSNLDDKKRDILKASFLVSVVCVFVSTAYFPWDVLSEASKIVDKLTAIQFPWRFLSVISLTGSISTVLAIEAMKSYLNEKIYIIISCIVILNILGLSYYYNDIANYSKLSPNLYVWNNNTGINVPEYILFPENTEIPYETLLVAEGADMMQYPILYEEGMNARIVDHRAHIYDVYNGNDHPAYVLLPIMNYDNYHIVDVATGEEFKNVTSDFGHYLIEIEIPAGYIGRIEAKYIEPVSWRISEIFSMISIISLVLYIYISHKRKISNALD